MDQRMDDLEQYSRKDNIRIVGIQDNRTQNDNRENVPRQIVSFLVEVLEIDANIYDISNAHRLGPKGQVDIIVRLSSNLLKQQIMQQHNKLKYLNNKIYINDDLTKLRALLYKNAREHVKNKRLYSTWTRDGNIFAKLHERSKTTKIRTDSDLTQLLSS